MGTLLVVLVVVCALAFAVHIGRGFWARTRSVERHRHALGTLADITHNPDGPQAASLDGLQHQAHVRLIGPEGQGVDSQSPTLPPPKAFSPASHSSSSPFRRPSKNAPSIAATDGIGARTTSLAPGTALSTGGGRGASSEHASPRVAQSADPAAPSPETRVMPALSPPPPGQPERAARPARATRPHVFYFDDLASRSRSGTTRGSEQGPATPLAGDLPLAGDGAPLIYAARGREVPEETTPPPEEPTQSFEEPTLAFGVTSAPPAGPLPGGGATRRRSGAHWARALAMAAAVLVVVAVGAVVALSSQQHSAHRLASSPVTSARPHDGNAKGKPASSSPSISRPRPTPTTNPTTTTTAAPKPVILVPSPTGTPTYQLASKAAPIVFKASGPCWIEVRAGSASGQMVYEGILQAGQQYPVTGPAWVRLGDPPYVALTVDGGPVSIPGATTGVPLDLQFTVG